MTSKTATHRSFALALAAIMLLALLPGGVPGSFAQIPANATPLTLGTWSDSTPVENNRAWFSYTSQAEGLYSFTLDSEEFDYDLYNSDMDWVAEGGNYNCGVWLEENETYYFQAYLWGEDEVSAYLKTLTPGKLTLGPSQKVTIENGGDVAWYEYTASETQLVAFSSLGTTRNTNGAAYILDSGMADRALHSVRIFKGSPLFSDCFLVAEGETYFFSVRFITTSRTGDFDIQLKEMESDELVSGTKQTSEAVGGVAWFSFTAKKTDQMIHFFATSDGDDYDEVELIIYDSRMYHVEEFYNEGGKTLRQLTVLPDAEETYFFRVKTWDGDEVTVLLNEINEITPLSLGTSKKADISAPGGVACFSYEPDGVHPLTFSSSGADENIIGDIYEHGYWGLYRIATGLGNPDISKSFVSSDTNWFVVQYSDLEETGNFNVGIDATEATAISLNGQATVNITQPGGSQWFQYKPLKPTFAKLSSTGASRDTYASIFSGYGWMYGDSGYPDFSRNIAMLPGNGIHWFEIGYQDTSRTGSFDIRLDETPSVGLTLNKDTSISMNEGETRYLSFTPARTQEFTFSVASGNFVDVELLELDNDGFFEDIGYDYGHNTSIVKTLTAGQPYWLKISDDEWDGSFSLTARVSGAEEKKQEPSPSPSSSPPSSPQGQSTISFKAGGGSGSMSSRTVKNGSNFTIPKNSFTRKNYTFSGWRGSDGKNYKARAVIQNVRASLTLTARWKIKSYKVTLKSSGKKHGTVNKSKTVKHGKTYTLRAKPRKGYRFQGWFAGKKRISTRAKYKYKVTKKVTLTAKFRKKK
ncbi:MAG: InlB B-repeat-containing protein [Oscillospiraceae bacterium]|nr:InlB B-repeat-containing protein [Oscillospiraceae bacterium]